MVTAPEMAGPVAVEICVDDVAGAMAAEAAGADRVELCAALSEGGITPSFGMVESVLAAVHRIAVQVMIRPRGGNFVLGSSDLRVMLADIAAISALAPAPAVRVGFVFGALAPDGEVDRSSTATLKAACGAAPTTFHRAFDAVSDRARALELLADLGIDRILTSGGAATASEGAPALAALVRQAGNRVAILAGGGVRDHNVAALIVRTGVREVHLRAMRPVPGRPPATCGDTIAAVLQAVRGRPA